MSVDPLVSEITKALVSLAELNNSEYLRLEDLGEKFGFKEADSIFDQIKTLAKQMIGFDISIIPTRHLNVLKDHLNRLNVCLQNIKNFDPEKPSNGDKPTLIKNLEDSYSALFGVMAPLISYFTSSSGYIDSLKSKTDSLLSEIEDKQKKIENEKTKFEDQANQIIQSLKDSAAKGGVTRHSEIFANDATDHKRLAKYWMLGLFAYIAIAIILVQQQFSYAT